MKVTQILFMNTTLGRLHLNNHSIKLNKQKRPSIEGLFLYQLFDHFDLCFK
jgi:hypothetical protein